VDEATAKRLLDAYLACAEIRAFAQGNDFDRYEADRALRLIIERLLKIVGEALRMARALDPDLKRSIPEIDRIIATRHHIAHGYDSISNETIWVIVERRIEGLQARLRVLLIENGYRRELPD